MTMTRISGHFAISQTAMALLSTLGLPTFEPGERCGHRHNGEHHEQDEHREQPRSQRLPDRRVVLDVPIVVPSQDRRQPLWLRQSRGCSPSRFLGSETSQDGRMRGAAARGSMGSQK